VKKDKKSIIGWIGVFITITFSSIWAYWGTIENFHEGWYSTSMKKFFQLVSLLLNNISTRKGGKINGVGRYVSPNQSTKL
jgi:uncharacterized protein YpbB